MKKTKSKGFVVLVVSLIVIVIISVGCIFYFNGAMNSIQAFRGKAKISSDDEYNEIYTFLENNNYEIDVNNISTLTQFKSFNEDIQNHQVILSGEAHAVATNFDVQLALLKYLSKEADVKYLLCEMGYSSAALIDLYVQTGDIEFLDLVYNELKETASWSKESYVFWEKLYEYNRTLEDEKKIKVIGIDIEHQVKTALDYLYLIKPEGTLSPDIKQTIDMFKGSRGNIKTMDDVKELVYTLQEDIMSNEKEYKEYFKEELFDLSIVVDNIINRIEAYDGDFETIRELSIYDNFKRVYNHYPQGKYFGQWGMEHVYKSQCNSYMGERDRFAMYLDNADSPVKGNVLSIAYGYKDCYSMTWGKKYDTRPSNTVLIDLDILEEHAEGEVTIFRLIGENSPFNSNTFFVQNPIDGATVDYFDYIVLIQNSDGTTPLE